MKFDAIPLILSLLSQAAFGLPVKEFIPSHEWQFVDEDVAIPCGLEVKMDLDKGGRWARYPPGKNHNSELEFPDDNGQVIQKQTGSKESALSVMALSEVDLSKLEDKAYDHDYGVDILRDYGDSLIKLYLGGESSSDHAGRILGICLRNNQDAARVLTPMSSDLVPYLDQLEKRPLMILSALITTPEGLKVARSYDVLDKQRYNLARVNSKPDQNLSRASSSLVQNLAVSGEQSREICVWADVCNKSSSLELKSLARSIYGAKDDFADVNCSNK